MQVKHTFLDALSAGTGHTCSSLALPSLRLLLLHVVLACSTGKVLCLSSGSNLFIVILISVVLYYKTRHNSLSSLWKRLFKAGTCNKGMMAVAWSNLHPRCRTGWWKGDKRASCSAQKPPRKIQFCLRQLQMEVRSRVLPSPVVTTTEEKCQHRET